jgi:hypothetical protein
MSKAKKIIEMLEKQINNFSDFVQVEMRTEFEIMELDEDKQSYLIKEKTDDGWCQLVSDEEIEVVYNEDKIFKVSNSNGFNFIPIDGDNGLMTIIETIGKKLSRCDCVFFDEQIFCFLEFKFNVKIDAKLRAIKKNPRDAIGQLEATIDKFDELLEKDYQDLNLEAYVCLPPVYPKNNAHWRGLVRKFDDKYQYRIKLLRTNEKICQ